MYKVFLQFPEALRPAFPRLKEKLEDPDAGLFRTIVWLTISLSRIVNPHNETANVKRGFPFSNEGNPPTPNKTDFINFFLAPYVVLVVRHLSL